MTFDLDYEVQVRELKAEFLACRQWELLASQHDGVRPEYVERLRLQRQGWRHRLAALRAHVRLHFERFDARRVSSLLALPSRPLAPAELLLHRIWLGGPVPDDVRQAICQWGAALDEVDLPAGAGYRSLLWVWDAAQLAGDPLYRPGADGVARYTIGGCELEVQELAPLVCRHVPALVARLRQLHAAGRYVNLSDYLRILVLREWGGIYLDADTMPYRAATVLLARPEVPDYVSFASSGAQVRATHVSWLNLVRDENGFLVARRGDPAVTALAAEMTDALAALPTLQPGALQQATYYRWRQHAGHTLLPCHDLMQDHGVLADVRPERVVSGVQGMRLRVDGDTGAPLPLSPTEQQAYERTVAALAGQDWRLAHPLLLERLVELAWVSEVPPPAYAPQLRADPDCCNYYSFLSDDPCLDRVNRLFAAYLLARNGERIARGGFWSPIRGGLAAPAPQLRGRELSAHE
ncbi:glycosyltransferase [Pseudoduganella chitinolytica]|uniref:Glycosyltransferase n=1 Tax=Pseudoduganella chitinolytica TaxID=34070 RepID=A0ABY8BI62_9BURK|nr:glycosyltransferase [Pseudoduganella chitinolytica]WEF34357.1 glycosyltransferase [Pseudoduganella chitinolytica]